MRQEEKALLALSAEVEEAEPAVELKAGPLAGRSDWADVHYEMIRQAILEFEEDLASDQEVGIWLAHSAFEGYIHLTGLGFKNPKLLIFGGFYKGQYVQLAHHVSHSNFVLTALAKRNEAGAAVRLATRLQPFDVKSILAGA